MASKKVAAPKWSTLGTSSGKGARIPRLLREIRSTDLETQEEAMRALGLLVVDDWQAYEAAAPVLEAVVDLAADATIPDRFAVIGLATYLVSLGRTEAIDLQGIALAEPGLADVYGRPHASRLLEAAERCVPRVVALLDDPDPRVVAHAANFLGVLPTTTPEVIAALGNRLARASESGLQVSLLLALCLHARRTRALAPRVREVLDARPRSGNEAVVDGALAVARTITLGELPADVTGATFERLFEGLAAISAVFHLHSKDKRWSRSVRWGGGRIDAIAEFSMPRGAAYDAFVDATASACARFALTAGSPLKREWPAIVLKAAFEERSLYDQPLEADRLSARQRSLLQELSVRQDEGPYASYGIPPDLRGRRRWLGVDPPGVLERVVRLDGADARIWQLVHRVNEQWGLRRGKPGYDRASPEALALFASRLRPFLTEAEWLDVWMELDMKPYGIDLRPDVWALALGQASPQERGAFVRRWSVELLRWQAEESIRSSAFMLFEALALDTPEGEPLAAAYDALFTLFGPLERVPVLLARIPVERREAIALREVERSATFAYRVERFAELVPRAAAEYARRCALPAPPAAPDPSAGIAKADPA